MEIGRIDYVDIREIWRHEAADFTTWLAENIEYLNEKLGITLSVLQTEKQIGSFNVDIYCEDEQGNSVIIENQFGRTDHNHLGQILTYAVGIDAKTIIWVNTAPRVEHVEVFEWLNEVTPVDMTWYMVKLEAIKIKDSPVAPLFSVVIGPSPERKATGKEKKEMAELHHKRLQFWEGLLSVLNKRTSLYKNISPTTDNWLSAATGVGGIRFQIVIRMDDAAIKLIIEKYKTVQNKKIFDYLYTKKETIESTFGHKINWRRMDNHISSRIEHDLKGFGLGDESTWERGYKSIAEKLVKWERTFRPYFGELKTM